MIGTAHINAELMKNYLIVFILHMNNDDTLPYPVMINAVSHDIAERAAQHMARHWWPDFEEEFNNNYWAFEQGGIEFNQIRELDEREHSVIQRLQFIDMWTATESKGGFIIRETLNSDLWQPRC